MHGSHRTRCSLLFASVLSLLAEAEAAPQGCDSYVGNILEHTTSACCSTTLQFAGNLVAYPVSEFTTGDLNGDGDGTDSVIQVHDVRSGSTINTGLAIPSPLVNVLDAGGAPGRLAILVSEFDQSADLNGDGDTGDDVLHLFDLARGASVNLGGAIQQDTTGWEQQQFEVGAQLVAFRVRESSQGSSDLNGDGDAADFVLHVYDPLTAAAQNLGLASIVFSSPSGSLQVDGRRAAFLVRESDEGGTDLNGDGDATDTVAHVYDADQGTVQNLGLAGLDVQLAGDTLAWLVSESEQGGQDLNGDGDATDRVVHVHDLGTGVTTNLGLTVGSSFSRGEFEVAPGLVAVSAEEDGAQDLNGNGSLFDHVLHVHDVAANHTTNLGLALPTPSTCGDFQVGIQGERVVFLVVEGAQGGVDLNGDGDGTDIVLHLYDAGTQQAQSLGAAWAPCSDTAFLLRDAWMPYLVGEAGQGNQDLNGDGDSSDDVLHYYDFQSGTHTNVALACDDSDHYQASDDLIAVFVEEADQEQDLNSDRDMGDPVAHVVHRRSGYVQNLALSGVPAITPRIPVVGRRAVFAASEASQGADLNGDGDMTDTVPVLVEPNVAELCSNTPNSTGSAARIEAVGSFEVSRNDLRLLASPVPNQPGLFFYGSDQVLEPFGDGWRCAGGTVGRLAPVLSTSSLLDFAVDNTDPPSERARLLPGSTWIFQAWFRDPAAAGAGFGLSSAIRIELCP